MLGTSNIKQVVILAMLVQTRRISSSFNARLGQALYNRAALQKM